jgi:signal transduction histidine kinase
MDLCDRAKSLVAQVLAFARADKVDRQLIDARQVIEQAREFMRATLPSTTALNLEVDDEPAWLIANAGQISQLVINLSIQGSQALEGRPGTVTIALKSVRPLELGAPDVAAGTNYHGCGWLRPDQTYLRISVVDNGPGMAQATLERIMEPFFAIGGRGENSGLGLSIVHGIVLAYGGAYFISSGADRGTRFDIYLPAASLADECPS